MNTNAAHSRIVRLQRRTSQHPHLCWARLETFRCYSDVSFRRFGTFIRQLFTLFSSLVPFVRCICQGSISLHWFHRCSIDGSIRVNGQTSMHEVRQRRFGGKRPVTLSLMVSNCSDLVTMADFVSHRFLPDFCHSFKQLRMLACSNIFSLRHTKNNH